MGMDFRALTKPANAIQRSHRRVHHRPAASEGESSSARPASKFCRKAKRIFIPSMSNSIGIRAIRQHPAPGGLRQDRLGGGFMGYITGTDSRQMTLAIGCVEDEVSQDSPAWFIAAFVDGLDLEALGFEHAPPAATGPAALQPLRPGEAVHLRLPQRDTLLPAADARMPAQCRAVLSPQPPVPGLPHHRRLPQKARETAQEDLPHLRAGLPGNETHGREDALSGREPPSARSTAKSRQPAPS